MENIKTLENDFGYDLSFLSNDCYGVGGRDLLIRNCWNRDTHIKIFEEKDNIDIELSVDNNSSYIRISGDRIEFFAENEIEINAKTNIKGDTLIVGDLKVDGEVEVTKKIYANEYEDSISGNPK